MVPLETLRHWRLGDVSAFDEMTTGSVNRVFRVEASRGVFYLRIYRLADHATVDREHALTQYVASTGLPALAPVAGEGGVTMASTSGQLAALFPQAVGEQLTKPALSRSHAEHAGDMLGRLHRCMASLSDVGYRKYQLRWPAQKWLERLASIGAAVRARSLLTSADEEVLGRLEAQSAWLADSRCGHGYEPMFSSQVIHGDYQHTNLFFMDDRVSGIIDWEQAMYMPRAFEVARAVAYMFDLEREATRGFLDGYREATGIGDDELQDGARAWGCMSDHYVWALEEVYLHGNERARVFIPKGFRPFAPAWEEATGLSL